MGYAARLERVAASMEVRILSLVPYFTGVAKLENAPFSKSGAFRREGSTPFPGTGLR